MNFILSKQYLSFHLISFLFVSSYFLESYLLIFFYILISLKEIKASFHHVIFVIFCCIILLLNDFQNAKQYCLMMLSIILISIKIKSDIYSFLKIYSYYLLIMLVFIIFTSQQKYGSFADVLLFEKRMWLIMSDGSEFNPNPLGLLSAVISLGFLINRKYFIASIPMVVVLLTQSRAAILFLAISFIFSFPIKLKSLVYVILPIIPFTYIMLNSNIQERFTDLGDNGRIERTFMYSNLIENNFLQGYSYADYLNYSAIYGSLDNMYLLMILLYGVVAILFILHIFYAKITNYKADDSRFRNSTFFAFLLYGFFEGGIASMFLLWPVFALSFNNFDNMSVRKK